MGKLGKLSELGRIFGGVKVKFVRKLLDVKEEKLYIQALVKPPVNTDHIHLEFHIETKEKPDE